MEEAKTEAFIEDNAFPIVFNEIEMIKTNSIPSFSYYDKASRRFIQFQNETLTIFNSKGNRRIREMPSSFAADNMHLIAVDTQVNYCLIIVKIDTYKLLMAFAIEDCKSLGVIKDDEIDLLLGMFIIESSIISKETIDICLVFAHKIHFYSINPSEGIIEPSSRREASFQSTLITSYVYHSQSHLLCCQMTDYSYALYDLSEPSRYTLAYVITLPQELTPKKSLISSGLSLCYSYIKDEKKEIVQAYHSHDALYAQSQYFIEVVYGKLYFILLSYENNQINFFLVNKERSLLGLEYAIDYQLHKKRSTLQVIDNLVIAYNFALNEICVFDVKAAYANRLLCYSSKMVMKGENCSLKGRCLLMNEDKMRRWYCVSFNFDKYWESVDEEEKYKALIDIMRRKKPFRPFVKYFNTNIVPKNRVAYFIHEVINLVWSHTLKQLDSSKEMNSIGEVNEAKDNRYRVDKDASDIIVLLSNLFNKANRAKSIVNHLLIVFSNKQHENSPIPSSFNIILTDYLRLIPINSLTLLLHRNLLPNNEEVLSFLLSLNTKHSNTLQQALLDFMIESNLHESIFAFLYSTNRFPLALIYWHSLHFPPQITSTLKDILTKDSAVFRLNRRLILQFTINNDD